MCWTQVATLWQASSAIQVRSMPALPVQLAAVGASLCVMVIGWPQLSVAVAEPVLLGSVESPQARSLSDGQVITGGVVSAKVRCWTHVATLWQASSAFQVRSMPGLPAQLAAVGASLCVMVTGWPQLSVAVAKPVLLGSVESPHSRTRSSGQVMTGGVVSAKLMCWTHVATLWQASSAIQVRSMPALRAQLAAVGALR